MFISARANLIPGDTNDTPTTAGTDVFIRHLPTGVTRRILGVGGAEPNGDAGFATLTSDGRYLAYHFGNLKLLDLQTNATSDFLVDAVSDVVFNQDGSVVAFQSQLVGTLCNGRSTRCSSTTARVEPMSW